MRSLLRRGPNLCARSSGRRNKLGFVDNHRIGNVERGAPRKADQQSALGNPNAIANEQLSGLGYV